MSTAIGWRAHSGWAVMVVVGGSMRSPRVLARHRVELLDGSLPRQPYHEAAEGGLSLVAGKALIRRVEKMASEEATAVTAMAVEEFGAEAVGLVGGGRSLPRAFEQILASHPLLHAAEGDLFEQALAEAAARCGLAVTWVPPKTVAVSPSLERAGRALGPPWQKDHKMAAAAALSALRGG